MDNIFSRDVLRGEKYNPNTKYIQINLSYGLTYKDSCRTYMVMDDHKHKFIDSLIIYEFNMDYYLNLWYNKNEKEIEKNKYLIMLNLDKEDLKTLSKNDKVVSSYMDKLNNINEDPRFQSFMSAEEDNRKIMNSIKSEYYDRGHEEGREAGLAEGKEAGLAEGRKVGLVEGKKMVTITFVKNMYEDGVSVEDISKYTGLDVEEVHNIINKIDK